MREDLTPEETLILSIIETYVNENRCFQLTKIIPFIRVRLREHSVYLNHGGIKKILISLIEKKHIIEGSKLLKEDLLENSNRERIYHFIYDHPGCYFNLISKELQLSNYILTWHLDMLLRFEFIRSRKIDNHDVYFCTNVPIDDQQDTIYYYLSRKKVIKVLNYIKKNPNGVSKSAISRDLGIHFTTITKYLDVLVKLNLLIVKSYLNKRLYSLNERYFYTFIPSL